MTTVSDGRAVEPVDRRPAPAATPRSEPPPAVIAEAEALLAVLPLEDPPADPAVEPAPPPLEAPTRQAVAAVDPEPLPAPAAEPTRRPARGRPGRAHARGDRLVVHVAIPARVIVAAALAVTVAATVAVTAPWAHSAPRRVRALPPVPQPAPLPSAVPGVVGPGTAAALFPSDVPDPYIVRDGSTYYMFATQPWQEATNIPLRVSTDLVHWRIVGDALPTLPPWAAPGHTWAPSILARPHDYLMYFTAQEASSGRQCLGTAHSAGLRGPFVPDARILECQVAQHAGSIDAQVFVDSSATAYLYWKSDDNALHRPSTLWGAQLSPDGMALVGQPVPLLHDDQRWETYTIEAPAMVRRAGTYWLFYSGSYLGSPSYSIGYALCASPLGPCAKQTTGTAWFGSGPEGLGPGEESFFTDAAGNTWMAYNAWPPTGSGYYHGFIRYPHVQLVRFTSSAPPQVSPHSVAVAASPLGGYYVLAADGTVYAEGGAPSFGWDAIPGALARAMAVMPDGLGYVVLDGYGGLHPFGTARQLPLDPGVYWPRSDIARAIAITPSGHGYAILDGLGGIHRTGDAPADLPASLPAATDVARALVITPDDMGYGVLLADGAILGSGDASGAPARWQGKDVARGLVMSASGRGYAVIDTLGDIVVTGDAPAPPSAQPTLVNWMGAWSGLALRDGTYLALRNDSFVRAGRN